MGTGKNQKEAFQRAKLILTETNFFIYYDSNKPLVLACNASSMG